MPEQVPVRRGRGRPKVNLQLRIWKMKRRVNNLEHQLRAAKKQRRVQRNLLKILQSKNQLQNSQIDSIDGALQELVMNEAKNRGKNTGKRYSDRIRSFAFTIFYYSPRAYRYLQTVFNLPAPRTIRRWLESVNCKPGFLVDVLDSISSTAGLNMYNLVVDAMSIRNRLIFDKNSNSVRGYVDYGGGISSDGKKLASEALVFLLVPITGGTRHPIAYFLIDKITAESQAELVKQCLELTSEKGITVMNLTLDGCAANLSTLTHLGASIPHSPHFSHPVTKDKVKIPSVSLLS